MVVFASGSGTDGQPGSHASREPDGEIMLQTERDVERHETGGRTEAAATSLIPLVLTALVPLT